jgi:probable phosphoglycerate mutase
MGRLLLLRHGQSTWNAERRWQGWADAPLSEVGRAQAREAAAALQSVGFDAVVSSDLSRARETAEIIAAELGLGPVELEPGLRERDVGAWSGLTAAEIDEGWPGSLQAWRDGTLRSIPEGEGDISQRVMEAVERVMVLHPAGTVLVVSHGGVIRSLERALGVEPVAVRNLGGRWVAMGPHGQVIAGEAVGGVGESGPAASATTTIL